jgi:NAD(P)-dependent dehydrogenase (short-subunit alcohol dehydrogenase family)
MNIALVTGAGRGLGQGFAQILSAQGYYVYAGVLRPPDAPAIPTPRVQYLPLDVTNDTSIEQAMDRIRQEHGKLNLLINNAGLNKDTATGGHVEKATRLDALDRRVLQAMFSVNAVGPLMVAKAAAPLMTEPDSFIINISSERASFHNPNTSGNYGYRASKAALNMFTRCLLFDLPKNISTFAVHPGWVKTDMNPKGDLEPMQAATNILAILQHWSPELNGQFLNYNGAPFDTHHEAHH